MTSAVLCFCSFVYVQCLCVFLLSMSLKWAEASGHQFFVYPLAPERLVAPARRLGKLEYLNYMSAVKNVKEDDEKLQLYAQHFSRCSTIGADTVSPATANLLATTQAPISAVQRLVDAIGVDPVSAKFFSLPSSEFKATIQSACLKNELQFQCAFGFLDDLDKIGEHIQLMKENDGTFKVMAEKECKMASNDGPSKSVYSCVNTNAESILRECGKSIEAYNNSRTEINERMHTTFGATVATIEEHAETAIAKGNSQALENVLRKGETLIEGTLNELVRIEAFKCRHYTQMERCLLSVVQEKCNDADSTTTVDSFTDLMRVGYLQRERGDSLHQQFVEANVAPHRACQPFA